MQAHVNHAVALISLRKYLPAMKSLQRALKLRPQDEQTRSTQSVELCVCAIVYMFVVNGHLELKISVFSRDGYAYRCKLINVRRFVCDWSRYEQDMQELRAILESQVANSSLYITGSQLLCHTPGNLLHFPLPLHIVSTLVSLSTSFSLLLFQLVHFFLLTFFPFLSHHYTAVLTNFHLANLKHQNIFLQHREVSRITSERASAAVVHLRQSIQTRLSKKLGGYRRTSTLRVGFVSFDYKNHPVSSSYTFTIHVCVH